MAHSKFRVIVNPFIMLLGVYGIANIYALYIFTTSKSIKVDMVPFDFRNIEAVLASLGLFSSLVVCWVVYSISRRFRKPSTELYFGSLVGLFVFALQIAYVIYSYTFGVNIAGVEKSIDGALKYLFYIFQSDYIFIAVSVGLKSNRWFTANALVYLISTLLRGWTGGIMILLIVIFCRNYPIHLNPRRIFSSLMLVVAFMAALPFIVEAKWAVRAGSNVSLALSNVVGSGYIDYVISSLDSVINRFQHLGHVALLVRDSLYMNSEYKAGQFTQFWHDGVPQQFVLKLIGVEHYTLDRYMVSHYYGNESTATNTNPGVGGWLFVLREQAILFVAYLAIITIPVYAFILRYAGERYLLLIASFSLIYLWHGWIGAYITLVTYMLIFIVIKRVRA